MALRRLRSISPVTARQLFGATVAPVMDYASNVWMHACNKKLLASLNRAQRIGAQAITGCFRTVATAVGEAESSTRTIRQRHAERAIKFWTSIRTLPNNHPLSRLGVGRICRRFISPLQRIKEAHKNIPTEKIETIQPYTIPPWETRIPTFQEISGERLTESDNARLHIYIATSSSGRNDRVGMGVAIQGVLPPGTTPITFSETRGWRHEQNPYIAELAAIAQGVRSLPAYTMNRQITILSRNRGALLAMSNPKQQSGQTSIREIYNAVRELRKRGNVVTSAWIPTQEDTVISNKAKAIAKRTTSAEQTPPKDSQQAKATVTGIAIAGLRRDRVLPIEIGKFSRELDTALPGKHTRPLYDNLKRKEAKVLAQLRTGMSQLNEYLYRIGAAKSEICACGQAKETVKHFLFTCQRWTTERSQLWDQSETRRGCLSFYLGGKTAAESMPWAPDMEAVRATIKYTIATGRLDPENQDQHTQLSQS